MNGTVTHDTNFLLVAECFQLVSVPIEDLTIVQLVKVVLSTSPGGMQSLPCINQVIHLLLYL